MSDTLTKEEAGKIHGQALARVMRHGLAVTILMDAWRSTGYSFDRGTNPTKKEAALFALLVDATCASAVGAGA